MKKIGVLGFAVILLLGAAFVLYPKTDAETTETSLVFIGENDNWKARLEVDTTETWTALDDGRLDYYNSMDKSFTIDYKYVASDFQGIDEITISYDYIGGGGSSTIQEPAEQSYTMHSSSQGSSLIREDSEIVVTVDLGDEIEEFYLTLE